MDRKETKKIHMSFYKGNKNDSKDDTEQIHQKSTFQTSSFYSECENTTNSKNQNFYSQRNFYYSETDQTKKSETSKTWYYKRTTETESKEPHLPQQRNWIEFEYNSKNDINNKKNPKQIRIDDNFENNRQSSRIDKNQTFNIKPFKIKISTYNLLAPELLEDNFHLYKNINKEFLDWDYRKHKIFQQIHKLNSDIFCLQELQQNNFEDFFLPKLTKNGYTCYFKKRYGNKKSDGCCICIQTRKFDVVKEVPVDYFLPGVDILNRENVGLILLLKAKSNGPNSNQNEDKYLCVATTHLLYNPKRGDCKLAQLQVLLANLDRVAYKKSKIINNKVFPVYHPTFLCGDFNCTNNSKIYEFLINSKLENYTYLNRNILSGQESDCNSYGPMPNPLLPNRVGISDQCQFKQEIDKRYLEEILSNKSPIDVKTPNNNQNIKIECSFGNNLLKHYFNFKSVYEHNEGNSSLEQNFVTTCVQDGKKTVDFIFYHSGDPYDPNEETTDNHNLNSLKRSRNSVSNDDGDEKLKLIARLELFTEDFLEGYSLPDKFYPSDHFLLSAKFILE